MERRTRTLIGARLAHVQLDRGHPEQAAATVLKLTGDVGVVTSARIAAELTGLRRDWQPYRDIPAVRTADAALATRLR